MSAERVYGHRSGSYSKSITPPLIYDAINMQAPSEKGDKTPPLFILPPHQTCKTTRIQSSKTASQTIDPTPVPIALPQRPRETKKAEALKEPTQDICRPLDFDPSSPHQPGKIEVESAEKDFWVRNRKLENTTLRPHRPRRIQKRTTPKKSFIEQLRAGSLKKATESSKRGRKGAEDVSIPANSRDCIVVKPQVSVSKNVKGAHGDTRQKRGEEQTNDRGSASILISKEDGFQTVIAPLSNAASALMPNYSIQEDPIEEEAGWLSVNPIGIGDDMAIFNRFQAASEEEVAQFGKKMAMLKQRLTMALADLKCGNEESVAVVREIQAEMGRAFEDCREGLGTLGEETRAAIEGGERVAGPSFLSSEHDNTLTQ